MEKTSLCIDLGGTSAKCALIKNQEIVYHYVVETKLGKVIENLVQETKNELQKLNLQLIDLEFIGLTVCGLIDYQNGKSIWSGNLQWKDYEVVKEAKRLFENENVFILNDSKAATYGEWVVGQNQECHSMMLYTIGTGIGGGLILDENLYFGSNLRLASEPGHGGGLQSAFQCNCDLQGCVEGLSSSTGIEKILNLPENKKYFFKKLKLQTDQKVTIKDIALLIKNGDDFSLKIMRNCLYPLAKHISITQHLLDLNKIVIGGGPSNLGQPLIDILKNHLKNLLLPTFYESLNLEIAKLKNDAGIWGIYEWSQKMMEKNVIIL